MKTFRFLLLIFLFSASCWLGSVFVRPTAVEAAWSFNNVKQTWKPIARQLWSSLVSGAESAGSALVEAVWPTPQTTTTYPSVAKPPRREVTLPVVVTPVAPPVVAPAPTPVASSVAAAPAVTTPVVPAALVPASSRATPTPVQKPRTTRVATPVKPTGPTPITLQGPSQTFNINDIRQAVILTLTDPVYRNLLKGEKGDKGDPGVAGTTGTVLSGFTNSSAGAIYTGGTGGGGGGGNSSSGGTSTGGSGTFSGTFAGSVSATSLSVSGAATFTTLPTIPLNQNYLLVGDATNVAAPLAPGNSGDVLTIDGTGAPIWGSAAGSYTFTIASSPSSITQNISSGNTVTFARGSSNNLTAAISSLNTVTYDIINNPNFTTSVSTPLLALGNAGVARGQLTIAGQTSGVVTLQTADATASYTIRLPDTAGTSGQVLQTDGSGTLTWVSQSTGTVTSIATGTGLTGGPITTTGTVSVATNGITNSLLRQSAGTSIIGRSAGTTGDVADITASSNGDVLRRASGVLGFGTIPNTSVTGLGTLSTQNGTFSGTSSGTNTGDQTITLTGDVTGSGTSSFAATIAAGSVTYSKLQNASANTVLARSAATTGSVSEVALGASELLGRGSSGNVSAITLGSGLSMSGTVLSATGGGGGGSGVTAVGTIDSQTKSADGAVISGTTIYLQTADASFPGLVSTGTQTIAGSKTLTGNTTLVKPGTNSVTAFQIQPSASTVPVLNVDTTNSRVGIANSAPSALLTLGTAGTTAGTVSLAGSTSGVVTLQTAAAAGTWSLTLPTSGGTNNYLLSTNGSGVTSWTDPGGLAVRWNALQNPNGSLALTMGTNPTTFNWATGTSTSDLFSLTTDASANGTGSLLNVQTGTSSTVLPLRVRAGSTEALAVDASGGVGVGTTAPTSLLAKLYVLQSATSTAAVNGQQITVLQNQSGSLGDASVLYLGSNLGSNTARSITNYNGLNASLSLTGDNATITNYRGAYLAPSMTNAATTSIANFVGLETNLTTSGGSGSITGAYGVKVAQPSISLNATNNYGLYIADQTNGGSGTFTNSYQIYSATTNPFVVNNSGNVGVGTASPYTQLVVPGKVPASNAGSLTVGSDPYAIAIQNNYAYIVNRNSGGAGTLQVVDISNPASPVSLGTASAGNGPNRIAVQGKYAFVTNQASATLQAFDISNPSSVSSLGTVATNSTPFGVAVQGRYAYVVAYSGNTLQVIDISNPASMTVVGSVATGNSPINVVVQDRYAYVVNSGSNTLQVIDISNPASPTSTSTVTTGAAPYGVAVQGGYAYVANLTASTLQVINIQNPASTTVVGSVATGSGPVNVVARGRYVYVVNGGANTVQTIDVSTPASPTSVGSVATGSSPANLAVAGRYVYSVNGGNTLRSFDVGGGYVQQLEAGGVQTGSIITRSNVSIGGDLDLQGGAGIGGSLNVMGDLAVGGRNGLVVAPQARTSGSPSLLTITGPADTTLTTGVEATDINFNLARTAQFATGAIATQRAVRLQVPTYGFVATSTITNAVGLDISGAPIAGTNATLTSSTALRVSANAVGSGTTASYGLQVNAQTGATNNYAATFMGGGVGIGSSSIVPTAGNGLTIAPAARTSGTPSLLTVSGPADTTLATGENIDVNFALNRTVGKSAGSYALQRAVAIQAPDYNIASNGTITEAASLAINGAPGRVTNGNITNSYGILVSGRNVSSAVSNSYGLYVNTQNGASENYAASFIGGNVGIGTAAPGGALDVAGGAGLFTGSGGITSGTSAVAISFGDAADIGRISSLQSGSTYRDLEFYNANTRFKSQTTGAAVENLTLLYNGGTGAVGIQNSTPSYILHVGSASITSGTTVARFQNAGGTCDVTPNVVGGVSCTSDSRFKNTISNYSGALDKLLQLQTVTYHLNAETETDPLHVGFIAQDLQKILPEVVSIDKDGYLAVSYAGLTPYLVEAVQQLNQKIDLAQVEGLPTVATLLQNAGLEDNQDFTDLNLLDAKVLPKLVVTDTLYVKGQIVVKGSVKTEQLEVGSSEKPNGITLYDEETKQPYCLRMKGGSLTSVPGVCAPAPEPNPVPTPNSELPTQPADQPTPTEVLQPSVAGATTTEPAPQSPPTESNTDPAANPPQ